MEQSNWREFVAGEEWFSGRALWLWAPSWEAPRLATADRGDDFGSTPHDSMSRSELFSRAVCVVATGAIWILTVCGIVIVGLAVATSLVGQLNVLAMLCIAPVAVSTCLGFGVLSNGIHSWLLSLFGMEPMQQADRMLPAD